MSDNLVSIEIVPHDLQRYDTVGDWQFDAETGELDINISRMSDCRYHYLVALHEFVEAILCKFQGVTEAEVDSWDKAHPILDEPGDHKDAPYHRQHMFAHVIERMIADEIGVNWQIYAQEIDKL